jgi:transcriptional regulator with PAS, ATPase and Fis domain
LETGNGGSVFLDEIGEMPLAMQVKLLRAIESREVLRVGGLKTRPIDVRFIAATHRDLEGLVATGAFREDLYFRMNGMTIAITPLRDRLGEPPVLATRFAADACAKLGRPAVRFSKRALALEAHDLPRPRKRS